MDEPSAVPNAVIRGFRKARRLRFRHRLNLSRSNPCCPLCRFRPRSQSLNLSLQSFQHLRLQQKLQPKQTFGHSPHRRWQSLKQKLSPPLRHRSASLMKLSRRLLKPQFRLPQRRGTMINRNLRMNRRSVRAAIRPNCG